MTVIPTLEKGRDQSARLPMKDACELWGVNADTIQKWADAGEIRIWQPGGKGGKKFVYLVAEKTLG